VTSGDASNLDAFKWRRDFYSRLIYRAHQHLRRRNAPEIRLARGTDVSSAALLDSFVYFIYSCVKRATIYSP